MNSYLHLQAGFLAFYGSVSDNDWHQHNAIQIVWPQTGCHLQTESGELIDIAAVIPSEIKHKLVMEHGWVLLIEPQSRFGEALQQVLDQQASGNKDSRDIYPLPSLSLFSQTQAGHHQLPSQLLPLWQTLSVSEQLLQQSPNLDARIVALQQKLTTCLADQCIKPDHWKASVVAADLNLSEGRFLHLFKAEMKIAWRPYLLWRRLLCAVQVIKQGFSATEAAHVAGFSDSAHLSRTFRKNFGLTIRQASSDLLKS